MVKYPGAQLFNILKVISKSLKVILYFTGNQCSSCSIGVICSLTLDLVTSLAAEFCNFCISFAGKRASMTERDHWDKSPITLAIN
jgi:hypothetical protein